MQSVNKNLSPQKNADTKPQENAFQGQKIARLAALTLIFSYAEVLIPRIIPFFRLGLGNAALLMAFELPFPSYLFLSLIKSLCSNLMAGTLISPFFIISLAQSLLSALVMWIFYKINFACKNKLFSLFGISMLGSAVSALVQIFLSSLYLGSGTLSLLGIMLIFNVISAILTAVLAEYLGGESFSKQCKAVSSAKLQAQEEETDVKNCTEACAILSSKDSALKNPDASSRIPPLLLICILLSASVAIFFIKNTWILCGTLAASLIAQKISKRRILIIPHISLWLFAIISCLLVPDGKILFSVFGFSITKGALITGIQKALRLSAVSALSQCAISLKPKSGTILAQTLEYYRAMSDTFRNTDGNIFTKLRASISN